MALPATAGDGCAGTMIKESSGTQQMERGSMNRISRGIAVVWTGMALLAGTAGAVSVPVLRTDADGIGLEANGTVLARGFTPVLEHVVLEARTVNPENNRYDYAFEEPDLAAGRTAGHPDRAEFHMRHEWGGVRMRYVLDGHKLTIRVAIDNRTQDRAIANFRLRLLDLALPDAADGIARHGKTGSTLDRPVAIGLPAGEGQLFALCETFYPPLNFGFEEAEAETVYPLIVRGGVQAEPRDSHVAPHMGLPHIPPGETLQLEFSLLFAARDAHRHEVLDAFHMAYRRFQEPMLDWPDRRPIGATFVMSENAQDASFGIDTINPRRLASPVMDGIDAFSPGGQVMIRNWMRNYAHRTVSAVRAMNGQGMILWNTEGAYEVAGHYPGSPDMQTIMAPELSDALDDYFRIIREAGLRTGVCIRPPQLRWNPDRQVWNMAAGNENPDVDPLKRNHKRFVPDHVPWWEVYPIAERMSAKIAYAKQRWGATLFYVDTSIVYRPFDADRRMRAHTMSTHIYRRIREDHPDVLIIPEIYRGRLAYAGHVATYGQTGFGRIQPVHGQDYLRDIFPHYFGFHFIHDTGGDPWLHRPHRINEAVWGEIFAADGWGHGPQQQAILEFTNQAGDAMQRVTALARRFGSVRTEGESLPFPYALETGQRVPTASIVADPPGSRQLRIRSAVGADRREAMLLVAWYGHPFADGTVLRAELPGVDLAGTHRRVWDTETGTLLSRGDRVSVPSSPAEMLRALYVRAADTPAPEMPEGVMLAARFDNGLAPDVGEDWLADHGTATLAGSGRERALHLRGGGGTAAYGVVPSWSAGTLEFDLLPVAAGDEPLSLVTFRHHMDTTLALVRGAGGDAALRLRSYERDGEQGHWSFDTISPDPAVPPKRRETVIPLPSGSGWRHIVLAWDAGLFRLYIDGERAGILAPRPAMERWRDGTLFQPGLIFGGGEAGGGEARINAFALYDWSFGDAEATGREVGAGRVPLAMPVELPPRVWMWGDAPNKVAHVTVNWRHVPNGVRARTSQASLLIREGEAMRRLRRGQATAWLGTANIVVKEDEEAGMVNPGAGALDPRGSDVMFEGLEDILTATREYVLEVSTGAVGTDPAPHRIPIAFDFDAPSVRYW